MAVKTVCIQQTFNNSVTPPLQPQSFYVSQAFSSVFSPSSNLLFFFFLPFHHVHLHSLQIVQTFHNWEKQDVLSFLGAHVCHSTCGQSFAVFFSPNNHSMWQIARTINLLGLLISGRTIHLLCADLCVFGSIDVLTAVLFIWLLLIYGSFFPLSLFSQALFLTHSESR